MRKATLKLAVVHEETSVAVVDFPTIRAAASAAAEVMQTGIPVAAMEVMDEVRKHGGLRYPEKIETTDFPVAL